MRHPCALSRCAAVGTFASSCLDLVQERTKSKYTFWTLDPLSWGVRSFVVVGMNSNEAVRDIYVRRC